MFAEILTTAASWNTEEPLLTYSVPPALEHDLCAGQLVAIPYGERLVEGIVWRISDDIDEVDVEHDAGQDLTGHPPGVSLLVRRIKGESGLCPHRPNRQVNGKPGDFLFLRRSFLSIH